MGGNGSREGWKIGFVYASSLPCFQSSNPLPQRNLAGQEAAGRFGQNGRANG